MVETITPVVYGPGYRPGLMLHVLGATAAAALTGLGLGALGALTGAPWGEAGTIAVALVTLAYLATEAGWLRLPIPDLRRQVPEWWRTYFSPPVTAFLYGAGLGVGFYTHLRHATLIVVAAVTIAAGAPLVGAAVFACFGLARSLAVAVARKARTPETATAMVDQLHVLATGSLPRAINLIAIASILLSLSAIVLAQA